MWRPLAEKFQRNSRFFSCHSVEPPDVRKPAQTERQNSPSFSTNLEKIEIFSP